MNLRPTVYPLDTPTLDRLQVLAVGDFDPYELLSLPGAVSTRFALGWRTLYLELCDLTGSLPVIRPATDDHDLVSIAAMACWLIVEHDRGPVLPAGTRPAIRELLAGCRSGMDVSQHHDPAYAFKSLLAQVSDIHELAPDLSRRSFRLAVEQLSGRSTPSHAADRL